MVLWVMLSIGNAVFLKRCSVEGSRIFFKAANTHSAGSDAWGFPDLPPTTSQLPPTGDTCETHEFTCENTGVLGPMQYGILKEAVLCLDACQT